MYLPPTVGADDQAFVVALQRHRGVEGSSTEKACGIITMGEQCDGFHIHASSHPSSSRAPHVTVSLQSRTMKWLRCFQCRCTAQSCGPRVYLILPPPSSLPAFSLRSHSSRSSKKRVIF